MSLREVRYQASKFNVIRILRDHGDGPPRPHEVVEHPGAAVILPILDNGHIIMIRNWRIAADQELLELPAGTLNPPESPLDCARRELREETGYAAASLSPLLKFYASPGICTELLHVFIARGLTPGAQELDPTEHITPQPMSLDAALREIEQQRIIDAKSIAALLYYARFGPSPRT